MKQNRRQGGGVSSSVEGLWRRGDGTNLIGIPSGFVGSAAFNASRRPLRIAGVREMNQDLFRMLETGSDPSECAEIFSAYMASMFGLDARSSGDEEPGARRRYRSSYLRLLRGWAYDSSSPEGAVLKGWVESRFGLFPTFHKEPLRKFNSAPWTRYIEEKMGSRFHNNAIFSQLDLLYEFAQWMLAHRTPDASPMRLFRGVNDFEEHQIVERKDKRHVILRLNNLVSFTSNRDVASCFGDRILQADVPISKVVFYSTLLPKHALKGEDEVIGIGGDYSITVSYY
jgi:NAD+---dinitrogen-reductase ADP-D-ribosyltransferase